MAEAQTTTDHDTIRSWIEERGGRPATVQGTGNGGPGLLRIDFDDGEPGDRLEPISWDDFFEKFEAEDLAFLYQDTTSGGNTSRFTKFVSRKA